MDMSFRLDNNSVGNAVDLSMGEKILWHWEQRKVKIKHDYLIIGWTLCMMCDVKADMNNCLKGEHWSAIEMLSGASILPHAQTLMHQT